MTVQVDSAVRFAGTDASSGRHVVFAVTDEQNRAGRSDYLLVALHGYRVKLRLTDFEGLATQATALDFFRHLLPAITLPYLCRLGPAPEDPGLGIQSVVDQDSNTVRSVVETLLARRGWDLKSTGQGAWTTVPQFAWPGKSATETWHGDMHPGYQAFVRIRGRGDSTSFAVYAPTVCDIGNAGVVKGQPITTTLQMLVAGGFAVDFGHMIDSVKAKR